MARILVIEDASLIRREILTILRLRGYDAIGAQDGTMGVQLAKRHTPDLIICDVLMPELDGYRTLQELRDDPKTTAIPFIFLTGRNDQSDLRRGMNLGADDYLVKPIDEPELLAAVEARLKKHAAVAEVYENEIQRARDAQAEAEAQLDQLRRAISLNVNHELRTSVASVIQTLDLVLNDRFGNNPKTRREYVHRALASTRRVHGLIEDLIALKDIDQGSLNTFRQVLDLNFDVRRPIEEVVQRWDERGVQVEVNVAPNVVIYAPKLGFRHAVSHLVDNACKFSPEGGTIRVDILANGEGGCLVVVSDNGPGIPEVMHERIFDRYFQASQGDARTHDGLGVGLTITRAFARALGGDVTILPSESGTQVEMSIPHAEADWAQPIP